MWQASAAPTKPHPQPLEPDSYLPVVYMQEAVDQHRDRQREPKERTARRGASLKRKQGGGVFLVVEAWGHLDQRADI